jgi:hypothetical protein
MKKVVWTLGMLALSSGLAVAQDTNELVPAAPLVYSAQSSALDKAIIANEEKVNEAFIKNDIATVKSLVAADGWMADAGGFSKTSDIEKMMAQAKITEAKINKPQVLWVDANTAIITYTWTGKGTYMGQPVKPAYVSSVWTKKNGKWVAVFHQETEAAPAPAKPAAKK